MTNQHRATDEQWATAEKWAAGDGFGVMHACLIELRARIQQLESTQPPRLPVPAPSPRPSTLVERVGRAIESQDGRTPVVGSAYTNEARAAIREVAAWLCSEYPLREGYGTAWASLLELESNR